ncbi:acyl-CoA dehydrogenase NM domain-like protein [Roridomyces roridus]|uniref:Acyl-CoA dehydrogenase NM domain-like protein n=1 Tax=Roridomyces roridus TaxID=1738132 RepID=A0AAD7F9Y3_9AGAR|nr:acyl-CoA dehydrogenase NM domain-like protein [Roridomyces roridus]
MALTKSAALASTPLFQIDSVALPWRDRIKLSYDRARAISRLYDLNMNDVLTVSQKYWAFQRDPIHTMDGAAATLLTIHYNLCLGTISMFPESKAELVKKLLAFEVSGQYCLTEVGHGLDAMHLETTATLLETGELEINTPTEAAAKFMPPTTPCGMPCVAVVFARLIVHGVDKGIRAILVPLHDGREMFPGITAKALSPRGGSQPVEHALTYFQRVRVPGRSLLGQIDGKALDPKTAFTHNIFRVVVGTLSMGALALSGLHVSSYVAGTYSMRRVVNDSVTHQPKPIIAFSTQKIPVLTALAQIFVLEAFCNQTYEVFVAAENIQEKHFIAAVFKTTVCSHAFQNFSALGDRCGAQGLFGVNQISGVHVNIRGASIAEGDILGISIRFAMDLIMGRVSAPASSDPTGILFQHESSIRAEFREIVRSAGKTHSREAVDSLILPRCQELICAVGDRLAVEAARQRNVDPLLIDLYIASVVKEDAAWFSEHARLSQGTQRRMEREAVEALYPQLQSMLERLEIAEYVTAPIVSDERWRSHVRGLPSFKGGNGTESAVVEPWL